MYQVVKQLRSSFAVLSALVITVISSPRVRAHQPCGTQAYLQCSRPLSLITDTGLTFVSTKSDLDRICPDLKEALRCIHSYTRNCMNLKSRRHFRNMFHGTGSMIHDLCRNGTYQEEYLKYAPCMKSVENENNVCLATYAEKIKQIHMKSPETNTPETEVPNASDADIYYKRKREAANEGIRNICCAFQELVECSTQSIKRNCGKDAAEFSYKFYDRMSSVMLQQHCTEFDRKSCGLPSSATQVTFSSAFGSLALLLSVLTYYLRWT